MRRLLFCLLLMLAEAGEVGAQDPKAERETEQLRQSILFNEIVRVALPGHAVDVSFAQGNAGQFKADDVVWLLDPQATGLLGVASRPIPDTAKAGESLGRLAMQQLRQGAAVHVRAGQEGAYVLDQTGLLWRSRAGRADTVRVGRGLPMAADVDVNSSELIAVLWNREVVVLVGFPGEPAWRVTLEEDLLPAVALAVSASGEIFVAGRGEVAVAGYDLDPEGAYRRTRAARAAGLGVQGVGGVEVPPAMILPTEGRETFADQDRFVFLTDADGGAVLLLDRITLSQLGRWDVRGQITGAAPGRLDVSNRGQLAYVDLRAGDAQVLPTRVAASLIEPVPNVRWRNLDPNRRVFRVQGGDTLQLPTPRQ